MNFQRWLFLFFTTGILGGVALIVLALLLDWAAIQKAESSLANALAAGVWLFFVGLSFSVLSQMGFFSYLLLHRLALGFFKTHTLWNQVQLLLVAFVLFDWLYFRYPRFAEGELTLFHYLWLPLLFLLGSALVAYIKAKQTNRGALIPALFFMYVITSVEALPALLTGDQEWILLMLLTIFICNTWQLLLLHRLTGTETGKAKTKSA